jgi:hypothetical protein
VITSLPLFYRSNGGSNRATPLFSTARSVIPLLAGFAPWAGHLLTWKREISFEEANLF